MPRTETTFADRPSTKKDRLPGESHESKMTVVVERGMDALKEHVEAWEDLAGNALEPNIFYEAWMMLPAVEAFGAVEELYFVFIYAPDVKRPSGKRILCGFLPLELSHRYKKLPVTVFSSWKHIHCFLCTPLLRVERAQEALAAFFEWLAAYESPAQLMEFRSITADGVFHKFLIDEFNQRACLTFSSDRYNRALFKPRSNAGAGISGRHKKELRRIQTRLAAIGALEYVALESDADAEAWINDFIQLEASGWKGKDGSALASEAAHRSFFESAATGAIERDRLMMLALRLNGKPIAMKCNFISGGGSFAFKIAFDGTYSRYSPGMLLEMENIR
ncbi:MAG: GNAT family N-acetyltransferase, partial [Verrucomicrobiota bacterium]